MRPAALVRRHRFRAVNSTSCHVGAERALLPRRPRCSAVPRRRLVSGLFARPEITLSDLERRLVQIVEGDDSVRTTHSAVVWSPVRFMSKLSSATCAPQPIRAIALASCAHAEGGIPHAPGEFATPAAAVPVAEPKDESADRMVQLWPPRNAQDPSHWTALSSRGVAQCKAAVDRERGGWLPQLRELHPPRGVVIISSSAACRESAEMILGKYQPNGDHFQ